MSLIENRMEFLVSQVKLLEKESEKISQTRRELTARQREVIKKLVDYEEEIAELSKGEF